MNPQTLLRLCSFTYFDLPELYARRLARGEAVPLSQATRALRRLADLEMCIRDSHDAIQAGGMQGERALHAYAIGRTADGERLAHRALSLIHI